MDIASRDCFGMVQDELNGFRASQKTAEEGATVMVDFGLGDGPGVVDAGVSTHSDGIELVFGFVQERTRVELEIDGGLGPGEALEREIIIITEKVVNVGVPRGCRKGGRRGWRREQGLFSLANLVRFPALVGEMADAIVAVGRRRRGNDFHGDVGGVVARI
jgi:hypothetical protein